VEWGPDVEGLVQALLDTDGRLLAAEGTATIWDFRVQFDTRADLQRFQRLCEANGVSLTLRRLFNPTLPERSRGLSDEQHEALVTAYQAGYFEVPRRAKMSDIATEFGVSDSALSQRIRRGLSGLIGATLMPEFGRSGERSAALSWDSNVRDR